MSLPTEVSTNQLASLLRLSAQRINQLAAANVLQKTARNKFNLAGSIASYIAHRERVISEERLGTVGTLQQARTELTEARAALVSIDLAERQRAVIPISEIEEGWAALMLVLRQHLLAVPTKLAPRLAAARSAVEMQGILRSEIHGCLQRIVDHRFEATAAE
jgi:phage terminase Nu1 subunit (DNA packaging protein)